MLQDAVSIETPDGISDATLLRPDSGASGPGVIHLTDIRGIRESHRDMAGRLVAHGFVVLMPNVFYRTSAPPVFNTPFLPGEARTMKRMQELSTPLTPDAMERDMAAYIDFLTAQRGVRAGKIGLVGYCVSGKLALYGAAVRPDVVAAAASFHGGDLATDAETSPHLLLPRIRAELYFGHAVEDRSMPMEAIETLDRALTAWGGWFDNDVYADARHGWTVPDHPTAYNPAQAERAFEKLLALFDRTLR